MMKKILFGLILAGLVLGGCGTATTSIENKLQQNMVTKTGVIQTKSADGYLLSTNGGIVNLTSNRVNLNDYMKKSVTVTGMFSGDVLYVDKLEAN